MQVICVLLCLVTKQDKLSVISAVISFIKDFVSDERLSQAVDVVKNFCWFTIIFAIYLFIFVVVVVITVVL